MIDKDIEYSICDHPNYLDIMFWEYEFDYFWNSEEFYSVMFCTGGWNAADGQELEDR